MTRTTQCEHGKNFTRALLALVAGGLGMALALTGCGDPKFQFGNPQQQPATPVKTAPAGVDPNDAGSTENLVTGPINDAKWVEGKNVAATIRTALDVFKAKNGGRLKGISSGETLDSFGPKINLPPANLALKHFNTSDFQLTDVNGGQYTITVSGTKDGGPRGTYTLGSNGATSGPR